MEDAATAVISLSLSFSLSLSPFASPALYALSNGTEAAKANAEKVRRGRARLFAYLCRDETKPPGDEIGEVFPKNPLRLPRSGLTAHAPTPSSLIARAVTSRRLTPRRAQPQQQQAPFHLPEKAASKGAPAVANRRKRGNPHPIPFRQRNWAPSPLRSRGSKAGPLGVSTAAPGQQSQGRLWASLYEAEAQASETLGTPCVVSETGREVSEWDPTVGRHRATRA